MTRPLRLGTRRSALALAQSRQVAASVAAALGRRVDLVEITTRGDTDQAPLASIGGTGVFVSALRAALMEAAVDLAVHSMKDLPTAPAPQLVVAAVPPRADARDALVSPTAPGELACGARIGTGSPRRAAVLRSWGLTPVPLRGNVDSRAARVRSGELDGVVLAVAGLTRLAIDDLPVHPLDPAEMIPAPGQGALAVETRAGTALADDLAAIDDVSSHAAVRAERAALAALEAGCSAPVGVLGTVTSTTLRVHGRVWSHDGLDPADADVTGDVSDAVELGRDLASTLLRQGAADLIPPPRTKETAL
jgi:hydroxymethylbilane synthase